MIYAVDVNFSGFRGCSMTYEVEADNEEEARNIALDMAVDDLEVDDVWVDD